MKHMLSDLNTAKRRAPRGYNREKKALSVAKWYALNADKLRERSRLWYANNPEKVQEHRKKYYAGWENAKCRRNPWDDVEDCLIMDRAIPDRQLSLKLGRSVAAILSRRTALKKLNAKEDLDLTRQ